MDERPESAADILPDEAPWTDKLTMLLAVVFPLLGCVAAIVLLWQVGWMGWLYVGLLVGGWLVSELGITIGFHRLLSHGSFQTYRWMRVLWMTLGALSVQGSPLVWCAVHRRHHQRSDQHGDPHSPHLHGKGWWNVLRGFYYSHMGWLFTGYWSWPDRQRYVPDLMADRWLVACDKMYYLWVLASLGIPAAIGGLATASWMGALLGLLWGGLVRVFIAHHITWSINSVCHVFGSREFETRDHSRNNLLFGLLAQGEGWHNNHHAFPRSARHGLRWWQFDLSWILIRTMELVGLAWNVRTPSERALAAKRLSS
ncbi:MAG: acyl-CoA desaturase [Planctomycetes bacterium]|nr:acyl-CoA desaturase [Planctomycetota bacterium]